MTNLFILIVALNIIDTVLTYLILKDGGKEHNPILKHLFKRLNKLLVMIIIKALGLTAIWFMLPGAPLLVIQILAMVFVCIVLWNLSQLKRKHIDKVLHFIIGAIIGFSALVVGPINAIAVAFMIGVIKETYDHFNNGSVEVLDVVATTLGAVATYGVVLLPKVVL